jgi:hypothetical protein
MKRLENKMITSVKRFENKRAIGKLQIQPIKKKHGHSHGSPGTNTKSEIVTGHGHSHGHGHGHGKATRKEESPEVPFCWSSFVDNLEPNKRKTDSLFHTKQAKSIIKTMDKLQHAKTELNKTDKEYKIKTRFIQRLVD